VTIDTAVDVTSPLYGPTGAAAVFAPQKGATADEVAQLDAGLLTWASVLLGATGRDVSTAPGSGAAGGTAAALMAVFGARALPGSALIGDVLGLDDAIAAADLVITGEGRLDEQSALGKGAIEVATRCRATGRVVIAVCGQVALDDEAMAAAGFASWDDCLAHAEDSIDAQRRAADLVVTATAEALRRWRA
jgi:glycerate kinase